MKKHFALFFTALIFLSFTVSAQDLEEIIDKHHEVVGLQKILETETMIAKGKVVQMGTEFPMILYQARPNRFRMEAEIQGTKMIQAFDGETGWIVMPWTGSLEPQKLTEEQLKSMKQMGDMEGDFYNWKEKGYDVSYMGEDDMEGTPVHKIKVVKEEGDEFIYYIDAENYVILKTDATVNVQGTETKSSTYYSNFKPVQGMIMPHSMETEVNGQTQSQIVIEEVKLDEELEDSMFEMPVESEE